MMIADGTILWLHGLLSEEHKARKGEEVGEKLHLL